jgi:hypothetical protein
MTHRGHLVVTDADHALLKLLGRDSRLEHVLARAAVVPACEVPPDVVTMNSRLTYADETAGVRTTRSSSTRAKRPGEVASWRFASSPSATGGAWTGSSTRR